MSQPDQFTPDSSPAPEPPFRRRWTQYSIKSLLILMLVVSVVLGPWSYSAHRQRAIVAALDKAGVKAEYDVKGGIGRYAPAWLVRQLGIDYFASVTSASFFGTNADPDSMNLVAQLPGVIDLEFSIENTEAGIPHLERLRGLVTLRFYFARVTEPLLRQVGMLSNLESLHFIETNVEDIDLAHLAGLKKLRHLTICECEGCGAKIARFQQLVPDCYVDNGPCSK